MFLVASHTNRLFASISYVLLDDLTKNCWIIDVGDFEDLRVIMSGYKLRGILLTHTHYDHIYGLNNLLSTYPYVPIYTNAFGIKALRDQQDNLSFYHDENFVLKEDANIVEICESSVIPLNGVENRVMETPGHDESSVCFVIENKIFTGDSYIPGRKVFTKLKNSDLVKSAESLKRIFAILPGLVIYPGHKAIDYFGEYC